MSAIADAGGRAPTGRRRAVVASPTVWLVYAFVLFFLALIGGIFFTVLFSSFASSWFGGWLPDGYTTRWYRFAVDEFTLWRVLRVTLIVAISVVVLSLLIGVPAAYALARRNFRGKNAVLLLLLLPTLVHFHADGGRISGDGVSYYVYVRSLARDADLDFTNEYTHYGLITREDIAIPTRTGLRRSIFAVGPALVWMPFFAAGEGVARASALLGRPVDLSGYGPYHVNAVALGSLLLGFVAVLLIHAVLARHFESGVALLAAVATWLATFLYWYMVQQPTMSHAPSVFGAALVVWLWDRDRERRTPAGFLLLGLVVGLAMCLRWQNAVLGLLPAFDLIAARKRGLRTMALGASALAAGALAGAFPQMAAWHALYGEWVLLDPPHGADFLRLGRPFVLETLFSSRHGLLSWTPVLWLGYLGMWPLLRTRRHLALPLIAPVIVMTYVNMCSGDWWAGGSFGNRRFDSLLPILGPGLAASIEWLAGAVVRRPVLVPIAVAAMAGAMNVAMLEGMRSGGLPASAVAFADVAGSGAQRIADVAGSPLTWPASWIFAARHHLPPGQYDLLVGRYLFYRQNNLQGHVDIGAAGDGAMLGEGWGAVQTHDGSESRPVRGRARILAPLDVPENIDIAVRARGDASATVRVTVNGREAGAFAAGAGWEVHRVFVPRDLWRQDINDVVLDPAGGGVWIDAVDFLRAGVPQGQERGFRAR